MRQFLAGVFVLVLMTATVGPAVAAPDMHERNLAFLLQQLRDEAQRHGQELPDLEGYMGEGTVMDTNGGSQQVQVPAMDLLRHVADMAGDVDLATLQQTDLAPGLPETAVGDTAHGYLGLRFFDCSARSYYTTPLKTPFSVPGHSLPAVPPVLMAPTVYGGPAMHIKGSGWLLGIHVYAGLPLDVNVHGGFPPSPALGLGLDGSIDSIAVGQFATYSIPIRIFGFCLMSIDLGYLVENGVFRPNGNLSPVPLPI